MIVADSSTMIVLARLDNLDVLSSLFGTVVIPQTVLHEVVTQSNSAQQRDCINAAIATGYVVVAEHALVHEFSRRLDVGEIGVLSLALEKQAAAIIMDDRKARNEARELGFRLFYTADILKGAAKRGLIDPYEQIVSRLAAIKIFLPE